MAAEKGARKAAGRVKMIEIKPGRTILVSLDPHPLSKPLYKVRKISLPSPELDASIELAKTGA